MKKIWIALILGKFLVGAEAVFERNGGPRIHVRPVVVSTPTIPTPEVKTPEVEIKITTPAPTTEETLKIAPGAPAEDVEKLQEKVKEITEQIKKLQKILSETKTELEAMKTEYTYLKEIRKTQKELEKMRKKLEKEVLWRRIIIVNAEEFTAKILLDRIESPFELKGIWEKKWILGRGRSVELKLPAGARVRARYYFFDEKIGWKTRELRYEFIVPAKGPAEYYDGRFYDFLLQLGGEEIKK